MKTEILRTIVKIGKNQMKQIWNLINRTDKEEMGVVAKKSKRL